MISRVLEILDDEASLADWLDAQIVASDVHELVAELQAVHGIEPPSRFASPQEVSAWLGKSLADVLARGTGALARPRLGELLKNPRLLPGFQELVFGEGGEHWQELARGTTPLPQLPRLPGRDAAPRPANGEKKAAQPVLPHARAARTNTMPRLVAALAASVLVAIGVWSLRQPWLTETPWGWNRPEVFAAAAAPDAYLDNLAAAAAEWSAAVPATERQLESRLRDLLAGCDRLLAAPHEPLAPADRAWLVERCGAWRGTIEGHRAALDASHDVPAVRGEADATVQKLVAALRSRAEEVRNRDRNESA